MIVKELDSLNLLYMSSSVKHYNKSYRYTSVLLVSIHMNPDSWSSFTCINLFKYMHSHYTHHKPDFQILSAFRIQRLISIHHMSSLGRISFRIWDKGIWGRLQWEVRKSNGQFLKQLTLSCESAPSNSILFFAKSAKHS